MPRLPSSIMPGPCLGDSAIAWKVPVSPHLGKFWAFAEITTMAELLARVRVFLGYGAL